MIIDLVSLSGRDAYLRDGEKINLVESANHAGNSPKLGEGQALQVMDLHLYAESDDFPGIYSISSDPDAKPLFALFFQKEMFPNLYDDPFASRVHKISGYEDFNRGELHGMRVMEVDGIPTLVSVGTEDSSWISPVYKLPQAVHIKSVAWDLPSASLAPEKSFVYTVNFHYWQDGEDVEQDTPHELALAGDLKPDDERFLEAVDTDNIIAYRMIFKAKVAFDSYLQELQYGAVSDENIGRPLLRALNILEAVESKHRYYSISELEQAATYFHVQRLSDRHHGLSVSLDLTSILVENESIQIKLLRPDLFKRFTARLSADVRLRPPMIDR